MLPLTTFFCQQSSLFILRDLLEWSDLWSRSINLKRSFKGWWSRSLNWSWSLIFQKDQWSLTALCQGLGIAGLNFVHYCYFGMGSGTFWGRFSELRRYVFTHLCILSSFSTTLVPNWENVQLRGSITHSFGYSSRILWTEASRQREREQKTGFRRNGYLFWIG